ncbi:glycoside hydrolase family 78 protein [Niabella sp. CC-SYL272]|uniref:glycoside hydrolase family 78 protein n=1 Tax=Niabella agricola TaxID=2891571 RepID=UPI001F2799C0|nr:glycoside hydrolase family 78 protein [Niabella agricola]MCF3109216.1 glycoside hydrolase family 78 protein [Niabella agricola]
MSRRMIILWLLAFPAVMQAQLAVQELKCEQLNNPVGIDVVQPRLSWQLKSDQHHVKQTAYRIWVASSKALLDTGKPDLWNSGKVISDESLLIAYKGKPLTSNDNCYWKVQVFSNKNDSAWSDMGQWSMGLLQAGDWKAKWIGYDKASSWDSITQWSRLSARYFRKGFDVEQKIKTAVLHIAGLGVYELYLNGKKIGGQVLAPVPTDYRKSVRYNSFDVSANLVDGKNAIGVVLGNGRFFTMRQNYKPKKINTFGYPKLLLQLEITYADGSRKLIVSDDSWKFTADGPIRTNNEYDGEEYDATKEFPGWTTASFDDTKWTRPRLVSAPEGRLRAQLTPGMRVMDSMLPKKINRLKDSVYILDMGQNFAGWLRMKVKGMRGQKVKLRFAESLQPDGSLYTANLRDARVTDIYTLKGGAEEQWQPSFVYHGFRYVEITGYPGIPSVNNFMGLLIYDQMATTGKLETSNVTLNQVLKNAWWSIASNYKGMPVDCPQRNERQPWLGDRTQGALGESYLFNNATLYAKWLDDIRESQTEEGAVPDVAPAFWNYYSDNVTWPAAYILVAEMLYRQYGDRQSIEKHYPSMKKWMEYMWRKYRKEDLITKDKYGDWCVPPESLELIRSKDPLRNTNGTLLATAYYYHLLKVMKQFAVLTGRPGDVTGYDQRAARIKAAFNKTFLKNGNHYDNNTATANLLPLYFGMVPKPKIAAVKEQLLQKLKKDNMHISTGVIGTQWLMRGLTKYEYADAAFTVATNKTYPSWGYMAAQGATTIWELWNGNTANPQMNSQNHVMLLGDLVTWGFESLAGIQTEPGAAAFKKIRMQPAFAKGLDSVNASYESPYGLIKSSWKRDGNALDWAIELPPNTSAVISIPSDKVTVSGQPLKQVADRKNNTTHLELGSGRYSFKIRLNQ